MTILTDEEIAVIVREAAKGSATRRDVTTSTRIARAIEAKILEKLNSQEPVAWLAKSGWPADKDNGETPLYAHPIPQDSAIQSIIEKVEKLTIERCANKCEAIYNDPEGNDGYDSYYTRPYLECALDIRNLSTGQIKLEELK